MASTARARDDDSVTRQPRLRGVLGAFLAAVVLVAVTAIVTAVVVDAMHGRPNPVVAAADAQAGTEQSAIDTARAQGYKEGVRDTRQQAGDQLKARYDQGFAKGYAKGRADVQDNQGSAGGYADGYNAGVQAAIEAYKQIIAQAQQIIAQAGQQPVTTAPQPTATTN